MKPDSPRSRLSRQHGRTLPSSACSAPPAPQRTLRSCFSLTLAPEFPVSQRAQTQPGPARPRSRHVGVPGALSAAGRDRERRDGASPSVGLPASGPALPPALLAEPRELSCPRRLWGTKAHVHTPGISVVSAQPPHLNVLLVPSWHSLLPDRFLQSKHFGAKQLSWLSCRCGNHRAQCLEGCCGFSP